MLGFVACGDGGSQPDPSIRFSVIADPHLFDPALGVHGPAFEAYLARDVKMLAQSEAVFTGMLQAIQNQSPLSAFVLIAGDLTKDGESASHRRMASHLATFAEAGVGVYVIPGNHDINNPEAVRYDDGGSVRVDSPDAEGFAAFYADFGYNQAIARDPVSLSYVAEPTPGVWLFAIDSCRYRENENNDDPIVGGRIRPETLDWLLVHLDLARQEKKTVIAMMHHGLVEHLTGQGTYFADYLIEDWDTVGHQLAVAGMNLVFTGHYHTQNITRREWDDGTFVVEVQTGSSVTFPNPYRTVVLNLKTQELTIDTALIEELPIGDYPLEFSSFAEFSHKFTLSRMQSLVEQNLSGRFNLSDDKLRELAPLVTDATLAHIAGDEIPTLSTFRTALDLTESDNPDESLIGWLLLTLWHDLPPDDNFLTFTLDRK